MAYTHTIYKCPAIDIVQGDYRSVSAQTSISPGTLLILEHGLHGDQTYVLRVVSANDELQQSLYPRTGDCAEEQVHCNVFRGDSNDNVRLFKDISAFNHKCSPNAVCVKAGRIEFCKDYVACFGAVYAIKRIAKGEEICISYGSEVGHRGEDQYKFQCDCGLTADQRKAIVKIVCDLGDKFDLRDRQFLCKLNESYTFSKQGEQVAFAQYCAMDGMYMINNQIVGISPRYCDHLKSSGLTGMDYVRNTKQHLQLRHNFE